MTTTIKELASKVTMDVEYGAREQPDANDDWRQHATGYTCTLIYGGRQYTLDFWQGSAHTSEPDVASVLDCLLSDCNVEDTFEDFCSSMGYDVDSRRAEKTHKACLKIRKNMKRLLGKDYDSFLEAERL